MEPSGCFLKFCFTKTKAEIYFTTSDFLVKVFYLRVKVVKQVCAPNTLRENIYFLSSTILQLKWLLKTKWWLDREFLQAMDSHLCPQNLDCWSYVSTACQQQQYKYDQKVQRTGFPDSQSSPHICFSQLSVQLQVFDQSSEVLRWPLQRAKINLFQVHLNFVITAGSLDTTELFSVELSTVSGSEEERDQESTRAFFSLAFMRLCTISWACEHVLMHQHSEEMASTLPSCASTWK